MRTKTFPVIIALLISAAMAFSQTPTAPKLGQIEFNSALPGAIVFVPGKGLVGALIDSSLVLDTSGPAPILRAAPASSSPKSVYGESYAISAQQASLGIANTPLAGTLRVYRNGIRLTVGFDYTVVGAVVNFAVAQVPLPGDLIVFDYSF